MEVAIFGGVAMLSLLKKRFLLITAFSSYILLSLTGEALAVPITATATGSLTPPRVFSSSLINGDFTIRGNGLNPPAQLLGDGVNDTTLWSFDFTSDPNLPLFPMNGTLKEALLTLELSPRSGLLPTDSTGISYVVRQVKIPNIPGIPGIGQTGRVTIDLLEFGFTTEEILGTLNGSEPNRVGFPNTPNTIPWFYQDDSIVSYAELKLHAVPTPEPSTLLGLGTLALAGGTLLRRKRKG